ncbi:MAG: ABC-type nitrate/sulfonate/bicarbonate transport system substrate-binding protein [Flammeovirgaceae bacterium]|jgi:ABC-type nitrate/sulfonate/bicarbonate transport system substrate-binding protein
MSKLKLALDWTPNINHIGFFVARELGFYQEEGIDLDIIDPSNDNYAKTPAKKVELGEADFALCPLESILSYRTKSNPFKLIAIATILQEDLSAIVVKSDSGINSPKELDGKSYASYQARYEDSIVRQLIKNDGGKGEIQVSYPAKLGIWKTLLEDKFDSTWIFMNWELFQSKTLESQLTCFQLKDYGIPYSYSPVIATNEELISEKSDAYKKFLSATKKGYLYAKSNPKEAIEILENLLPEKDKSTNLHKALEASVDSFGSEENWGKMNPEKVKEFMDWIYANGLETQELKVEEIISDINLQIHQ